ncbi:MAG: helix-turn-helix domain-containing protein [Clostridiales bacterium]|nr:helix-turn-helix domain-containing protein [Clostridiales bacterium]
MSRICEALNCEVSDILEYEAERRSEPKIKKRPLKRLPV